MEGWQEIRLKELISEMADGGTPSTINENNFGGNIPWAVVEDVTSQIYSTHDTLTEQGYNNCSAKLWPTGTIILTTGATIGKVGIAMVPLCTKQGITGIVCNKHSDGLFIKYWLEANTNQLIRFAQGTTFKEIRARSLGNLRIKVPNPFTERGVEKQKAIAKILSKVDEAIASVQNCIASAERLKKSLMQNLLTGKMKPDGIFRTPEEFYIDEKFGKVPVGWEVKKLKDIASIQRGKFGHRPRNDERFYNGDFPFVQTSDVVESVLYLKSASQSLNELGASVSKRFPQNTIIMTIAANIGYVALTRYEVYFPDSLIGINANENIVKPTYLLFQLMGFKNVLDALATESAQKNINYSNLRSLPILFPTNREEQLQIAEKIIKTFKEIEDKKSKIDILERLKKSLMQNLLTGKVRIDVEQISNQIVV